MPGLLTPQLILNFPYILLESHDVLTNLSDVPVKLS